jgi:hypothetical protein
LILTIFDLLAAELLFFLRLADENYSILRRFWEEVLPSLDKQNRLIMRCKSMHTTSYSILIYSILNVRRKIMALS